MRRNLYELDADGLASWLSQHKEQPFRAGQILGWAYQKGAASFEEMTDLPQALREGLAQAFEIGPSPIAAMSEGHDTVKLLLDLPRGGQVECVRIKMGHTYTACLSTQVGCSMGCIFCATGQHECERSLKVDEMVGQVISLGRLPTPLAPLPRGRGETAPATASSPPGSPAPALSGRLGEGAKWQDAVRISNVVFMGMGEPFMNYANLVETVRRLIDKRLFGMSPSRITVSTVGIVPAIKKYAHEGLPTELTISLNAPNDKLRKKLMPGSTWTIAEIMEACREYTEANHGQPVTFAYVLIQDVNDLLDHARELAQLLRRQPHHVNVIPLNPVSHTGLHAPDKARAKAFVDHCGRFGLNVSLRRSKGAEVDAACGQLRGTVEEVGIGEAGAA